MQRLNETGDHFISVEWRGTEAEPFLAARNLLDRVVQIQVQAAAQQAEVHAACPENAFAVWVVRQPAVEAATRPRAP